MHEMGAHRGSRCLAMSAGEAQTFVSCCQCPQYLSTFLDDESIFTEIEQFFVVSRNGRSIDNQTRFGLLTSMRDVLNVFLVVDNHAFLFQPVCQVGRSTVITSHHQSLVDKISGDGTHSNATCTNEINCFYIF